jgi:hypothetical protein
MEPAAAFASAHEPAKTGLDSEAGQRYCNTTRAVLGLNDDADYRTICAEQAIAASLRRRQLQTWMHVHPGWMPTIRLKGDPHTDIANAHERPVIYWIDNTVFAELIARAGLHQAGIRAHHYSDWVHEYGQSLVSRLILQRRIFKLEQRFMGERIVSHPHTHFRSMRRFAAVMRRNGAIFNMNNAYLGRRHACVRHRSGHLADTGDSAAQHGETVQCTHCSRNRFRARAAIDLPGRIQRATRNRLVAEQGRGYRPHGRTVGNAATESMKQFPAQWLCWSSSQLAAPEAGRIYRPGM